MADKFDRETFERVFSDAHIVDIDFSEWDKKVSLWVLADHYEAWTQRRPLIVVDFLAVLEFAFKMPSADFALKSQKEHLQWNADDFEIEKLSSSIRVRLFGPKYAPSLTIECQAIVIRQAKADLLDQKFPGWNQPYSGFVRPGPDN